MKFLSGQYLLGLWALLLLPPLFALFIWRSARSLRALLGKERYHHVRRHWLQMQLFSYGSLLLAGVLLLLAAAEPLGGRIPYPEGEGEGILMALVVDVSRSMMAEDIAPNRLARGSQLLQLLLQLLPKSMFTLIAFKGDATTLVPPTQDQARLKQALGQLSPQILPSTGTKIDAGLQQATDTLAALDHPRTAIILLSDGGEDEEAYRRANSILAGWQGQLYVIGTGKEEGSQVLDRQGRPIQDRLGRPINSKLNRSALTRLATHHRGYYYSIEENNLAQILRALITPLSWDKGNSYGLQHRYRPFVVAALILLLLAWLAKRAPLRGQLK